MHEFIQGGELKRQAKRLLGYRIPLVLVIIVNVVLIARVPLPAVQQAQAQAPASSSWTELDAQISVPQISVPQISVPVPALASSLAQPAPAADALGVPHDATQPDTTPPADAGLAMDTAINATANSDATLQPELSPPAEWAADDATAPKPNLVATPDLPTGLLGNWQQDAQQLVQNWRGSAQSLLSQQRTPSESTSTVPGTENGTTENGTTENGTTEKNTPEKGTTIDLTTPPLDIVIPAELSPQTANTADVQEPPSIPVERALNETSLAVRNPLENAATIRFLVNSRLCELQPGEAHQFPPAQQWLVQFHPGGEFQDIDRTVTTGVYQFVITQQGWDLVPVETTPVATDGQ